MFDSIQNLTKIDGSRFSYISLGYGGEEYYCVICWDTGISWVAGKGNMTIKAF